MEGYSHGGAYAVLTRSDFDCAVRDALRRCARADLLLCNPLLQSPLMNRSSPSAASPQALKALLEETARTLFASGRDERIYRILDLTYFNPAPKQEAAAERLGLSFSTYRRHLAAGVERLSEWLWQRELELRGTEPNPERTVAAHTHVGGAGSIATRPRLSIVILPFLNLSRETSADYLVDGIVDALIANLATCLPGSFVISRSTAFTYKGRSVSVRQVGEELGVRYVLEGSVSLDAERIRVNVQLIDAATDQHLWAERFDKERGEILQVQDEVVARLSRGIGIQLVRSEAGRGSSKRGTWDVVDLVMRARALITDVKRKETATEAIDLFGQALRLDPDCVAAMVGIALTRIYQVIDLHRLEGRDALLDEAEELISRAASQAPDDIEMLTARALLLRARGRFAEAVIATDVLIGRNPAEPTAYKEMGLNNLYLGRTEEAVEWFRRADSIAPRDPARWTWLQGLGRALLQRGDDAGAIAALSQAVHSNPAFFRGKALLAAAEALAGNFPAARQHLAEYAAFETSMTVSRFAEQRSSVPPDAVSETYRLESERILRGLRLAGMAGEIDPEHQMSSF